MNNTHTITMEPEQYKRRILLVITGLSPQVVTETLYALAVDRQPAYVPTEIHLITTTEGASRARLTLLSGQPGWFERLRKDYRLPQIAFSNDQIHVLKDDQGQPMQDIRTPEENTRVADQLSELVRGFAEDEQASLHVSLAGGRKTMGFYLGYALSLYGRVQDRLSHVLVSAGYESSPDFFYPTPESTVIFTPGDKGRPLDAAEARVTLADIPFVRLREGLPERLLKGHSSFSDTIEASQRVYEPASLVLDIAQCALVAAGQEITLNHTDMAFYAFLAKRAAEGKEPVRPLDGEWRDDYLAMYRQVTSDAAGDYERVEKALENDEGKEYFEQRKSRTNSALKDALGKQAAERYSIHPFGNRPKTRFGLKLNADAISFV